MNKEILRYGLRLWLTVAIISLILFQFPLYYIYKGGFDSVNDTYPKLLLHFLKNWFVIICILIIPSALVFRMLRALYQPGWSTRGIKLILLLVSEFLMMFFLVINFFMLNSQYLLPTGIVLLIFAVSHAMAVYIYPYTKLKNDLYQEHLDME